MSRILKILVIEELPAIRDLLRKGLDGMGQVRLLFAPSVKGGFVALKKTPFDILMLSGSVARRNDYALLRAVRADDALAGLSVMVILPECGADDSRKAVEAGAAMCLAVSSPEVVKRGVAEVLRTHVRAGARVVEAAPESAQPAPIDPIDPEEDARRLFHAGMQLLSQRLYAKAAKLFLAALKRKSIFPEALLSLAECSAKMGDTVKAYVFRRKAVTAFAKQGRMAEAGKVARKLGPAPEGAPAAGHPMLDVARELNECGYADRALEVLESAAEQEGEGANVFREVAAAYLSQGSEKRPQPKPSAGRLSSDELHALLRNPPESPKAVRQDGVAELCGSDAGELGQALFGDAGGGKQSGSAAGAKALIVQDAPQAGWKEKRRHPRIPLADFFIDAGKGRDALTVVDISMGGISFKADEGMFEAGQVFRFHLMNSVDVCLKKVQAVVRFVGGDRVGCQFLELSAKQTALLTELIRLEKKKILDAGGTIDEVEDLSSIERDSSGKIVIKVDW
ncbi:MAG: PilZ domain-containing protein [Halodesulfovibrio sp.]